jgi:hypothetical protein
MMPVPKPGGDIEDQRDTQYGYGRTQPEFSLGERMATMEARLNAQLESAKAQEEQTSQLRGDLKELFMEKIGSVRQEMGTKDTAQKEAIGKAEKAAAETATALATELRSSRETSDTRLGALERGGAAGPVDLEARLRLVERGESAGRGESRAATEFRGSTMAWVAVAASLLGGGLIALIVKVAGG